MDHIPSYSSTSFSLPSLMSHEGNKRFFPNRSYTILLLCQFFSLSSQVRQEDNRRFFPNGSYTILLLSEFFLTIPYLCISPLGNEYASMVEKVEVKIEIEIETKFTSREEPHQNRQRWRQKTSTTRRSLGKSPKWILVCQVSL